VPSDIGAAGDSEGQEVEQPSTVSSWSRKVIARKRKRKRTCIITTLASSRTRRKGVKYEITRVGGGFHRQYHFDLMSLHTITGQTGSEVSTLNLTLIKGLWNIRRGIFFLRPTTLIQSRRRRAEAAAKGSHACIGASRFVAPNLLVLRNKNHYISAIGWYCNI